MQFSISKTGRLATLCGFLSSVALGCVLSLNDSGKKSTECPEPEQLPQRGRRRVLLRRPRLRLV
jgi:hypothetical protein